MSGGAGSMRGMPYAGGGGGGTSSRRANELIGWQVVLGGILLHLTLGTLYSFGNIQTYLVSYLRAHADDSHDFRYGDSTWIFTLATTGQAIAMFFGGKLEQRIGPRKTVLLGADSKAHLF